MSSADLPVSVARTSAKSACSARGSRAEVGSSRMTKGASRRNARASATHCHWPSERSWPSANSLGRDFPPTGAHSYPVSVRRLWARGRGTVPTLRNAWVRRVQRYQLLSAGQRRDLRHAMLLIPVVVVGLRIAGYVRFVTVLNRTSRRRRPSTRTAPVDDARAVAATVSAASRLVLVPSKCLDRSLVTCWMLRRRGIPALVRLGAVPRRPGRRGGHEGTGRGSGRCRSDRRPCRCRGCPPRRARDRRWPSRAGHETTPPPPGAGPGHRHRDPCKQQFQWRLAQSRAGLGDRAGGRYLSVASPVTEKPQSIHKLAHHLFAVFGEEQIQRQHVVHHHVRR